MLLLLSTIVVANAPNRYEAIYNAVNQQEVEQQQDLLQAQYNEKVFVIILLIIAGVILLRGD